MSIITCMGCGCDDDNACVSIDDVPCFWIRKDQAAGVGVCSHCPEDVARFDSGDRALLDDEHGHAEDDELVDDDDSPLLLPGDDDFDETLEQLE